jgi:hypothetical protein
MTTVSISRNILLLSLLVLLFVSHSSSSSSSEQAEHDDQQQKPNRASRSSNERSKGISNSGSGGGGGSGGGSGMQNNKKALSTWATSLTEADHNATYWSATMRKQPQNFFYEYAKRLNAIFQENEAIVNFALVGACDGTNDNTISDHYFPNPHWQGLFVEPVSYNYKDLLQYLDLNHASERSYTINAAITDVCDTQNVSFKVSRTEEKNPEAAHWLRRQIGSIVKENEKLSDTWKIETVRCSTPLEIMAEWTAHLAKLRGNERDSSKRRRQRLHVLKIDAEGHDYKVCCYLCHWYTCPMVDCSIVIDGCFSVGTQWLHER